jgi:uncharacterized repeat protein (TIGR03803 family)
MKTSVQPTYKISGLRQRAVGAVLALAVIGLAAVVATRSAQAQTFTLLHTFAGAPDGADPLAGLVQDAAGNFYGTTQQGGITGGVCANSGLNGCGTIFRLDPAGNETVLYRFTGGTDGQFPAAGLVLDAAGNLYGTTQYGGPVTAACGIGCGTVFKLDSSGNLTPLHDVGSTGGLVMDAKGILYGSTSEGIFMLDPATKIFTVLDPTAGSGATLALDAAGNLYGTTGFPGSTCDPCGTVFKWDTATKTYTTLYSFTGMGNDGNSPLGGVVLDGAGNLWGTTSEGGAPNCGLDSNKAPFGCGTVFEVSPAGGELKGFSLSGPLDPTGGLVLDAAGSFYGTSKFEGSAEGKGTVFEMGPDGIQKLLYTFMGLPDGQYPLADLVLDSSGNLYGTASVGGPFNFGTVFKINPTGPQNFPLAVVIFGTGTVTGSGVDCSTNCATWVSPGTMFTLTATPLAGGSFVGWVAPPCSGTGTCSVTINSAQTVGATFDSDFTVSATALMPAAVSAGGSATSTINVAADANGFFSSVALTCSVTPTPALAPTCSISPNSVMPGTPATLTVSTTAATAAVMFPSAGSELFYALCLPLVGLVATTVGFGSKQKSRKGKLTAAALTCLLFTGLVLQIACGSSSSNSTGGGGSKGTPAGTYTITVTGTYSTGSLVHTTPTMLTVQ